jgi:hypothetical protein
MPIIYLVLLFLTPGYRPWPPPDAKTALLIREARERNQAGIAAVRTLTCRIDESWQGRKPDRNNLDEVAHEPMAWDYWFDGDTVRVRQRGRNWAAYVSDKVQRGNREMWLKDDTLYVTRKKRLSLPHGDARSVCLFARWDLSAFARWGLDTPYQEDLTLADMLARPHEVWAARRVVEEGVESVYLDLAFPNDRVRLWLDPAHNYLVWKTTMVTSEDLPHEYRVTKFQRATDGTVLPIRIENRMVLPGVEPITMVTTLSDVRLNEPVPADSFRIPGLKGMRGYDRNTNETYTLDENGERVPPEPEEDNAPASNMSRITLYILCGLVGVGLIVVIRLLAWRADRRRRTRTP